MFPPTQITRRHLPHWRRDHAIYWVTFRLADSLPAEKLAELHREKERWLARNPEPWSPSQRAEHDALFSERIQDWLDAGHGSCVLARPEIRALVRNCLLRFDGDRLRVHAAVIMPNHVHALLEPLPIGGETGIRPRETGIPACPPNPSRIPACPPSVAPSPQARMPVPPKAHALSDLLRGIKGASARAANKQLGRTESVFWMDESYDRIVRDRGEYDRFLRYLLENPAKARLPADHFWLWPARETGTPPETGKNACPTAERETGIPACPPTPPSNPQAGMPVPPPPSPASSAP